MSASSKKKADTVFGLPNGIFGPLSSSVRRDYAQVLLHLYRNHLALDLMDGLDIRKSDMIGFLANALSARKPSEFVADANNSIINSDPATVYRHLVTAGWFIERTVGAETLVVILRSVMELLRALDGIERGSSVNFTGSLQTIDVALKAIKDDPRGRAMMLAVSAQQAEEFMGRMLAVNSDIRANESNIISQSNFSDMMSAFFDDFVAHLVSDYKAMKSRYNPLRHAASILTVASSYLEDNEFLDEVAQGYIDCGFANNKDHALTTLKAHIDTVSGVFSKAQNLVDDIDNVRIRVEERIARAVRFIDAAAAAETSDIEEIMSLFGDVDDDFISSLPLPPSNILLDDFPFDEDSFAKPRIQSPPVKSVGIEIVEHNSEMQALSRARVKYAEDMIATAEKMETYIESHLKDRDSMLLSEFVVSSPSEMMLFTAVRSVMGSIFDDVRNRYGVTFDGAWVDGLWSTHSGGVIYRKGSLADPDFIREEVA